MDLASTEDGDYYIRTTVLVAAFTVILTTNFVGAMGLLTGQVTGTTERLPFYVLLGAIVFVGTILVLEASGYDGRAVLTAAVTASAFGFVFVVLGGEGLVFAWHDPDAILTSQLLVYFVAAAVIGTGLGYWGLRHWREFARGARR